MMGSALHFEWTRVRTVRSTWILVGATLVLQFLVSLIWGGHHDMTGVDQFESSFSISSKLATALIGAIGVSAFGNEYQHRTIVPTLLTLRSRPRVLAAKSLIVGGVGAVTGLAMIAMTMLGLLTGGSSGPGWTGDVATATAGLMIYMALAGVVGVALGGLTRHAVAALAIVILWPTVLELAIVGLLKIDTTVMPFAGASSLFSGVASAQWVNVLPLVGLSAVLIAANGITLSRRDA